MKKEAAVLSSVCAVFLAVVIYGLYWESQLHGIFNGSYVHILVAPLSALFLGLIAIVAVGRKMTFWKKSLLGSCTSSAAYLSTLLLFIRHYGSEWQPEWYIFWAILSVVMVMIVSITHRIVHGR